MLHSLLHSSHEAERTVPRQRSHQLWPTKHCRVVRKYWAQRSNSKLASAQFGSTRSPTVQCLWLCGQSQARHRESRYVRQCANSLCCAWQRPCHSSLLINASLASCWYQHRFRPLLRSPRIFSWHGFSNYFVWYLHADTDDLATRSGQNLKSPGFIQKIHSYWCLSSKWFSEISFSSRNHNVCQSWECEMGTDSKRPFKNWRGLLHCIRFFRFHSTIRLNDELKRSETRYISWYYIYKIQVGR